MNTVTEKLSNGNVIRYKVVNGTAYHEETADEVVRILENARQSARGVLVRFCYGDTDTGRDWGETCDTTGYIGRSTGSIKIPILIRTINSSGGPGLLDHCIVRVEEKNRGDRHYREAYQHPKYHKENDHE